MVETKNMFAVCIVFGTSSVSKKSDMVGTLFLSYLYEVWQQKTMFFNLKKLGQIAQVRRNALKRFDFSYVLDHLQKKKVQGLYSNTY